MSENLFTTKSKTYSSFLYKFPHPKYLMKFLISCSFLECWEITNLNLTDTPVLVLDLDIVQIKLYSPDVKPANHWGFSIIPIPFHL